MFEAMDTVKRQFLLDWIEDELKELESPKRGKYCLWNCPECERILISGGLYGWSYKMEKDIAVCIGSYAYHRPKKWFRNLDERFDINLYQERYLVQEDAHKPVDMNVNTVYLTREQYINTFE